MVSRASSHHVSASLLVSTRTSRPARAQPERVVSATRFLELLSLGVVLLLLASVLGHHLHALSTGEAASDAPTLGHD